MGQIRSKSGQEGRERQRKENIVQDTVKNWYLPVCRTD